MLDILEIRRFKYVRRGECEHVSRMMLRLGTGKWVARRKIKEETGRCFERRHKVS